MNRVFKVCMFVICSLLLLSSCDKDHWDEQQRNSFYGYNVENHDDLDLRSITKCSYNQDTTLLTGIKNEKMWIGMFDEHTKEQLKEWNGTEIIERNIKIDRGYGVIETMRLSAFHLDRDIHKTNWGFTMIPYYTERDSNWSAESGLVEAGGYRKDILLLKGDNIITFSLNNPNIINPCWFQESVIVSSSYENGDDVEKKYYVIFPEGKKIVEWLDNSYSLDHFPVSYTEGIFLERESDYNIEDNTYSNYYSIIRHNYQMGKDVWKTSIPSLKDVEMNARINTTILEQSNSIWKYQIDITNYDGSKKQVIFTVDVETGKVTEI